MHVRPRNLLVAAALLLAAVATPFAAADAPAEAASLDSFLTALAVEQAAVEAPVCTAPAAAPSALETAPAGELDLACSCRNQCSVARDCDRICGKGLGQCVMVNSCCRECICSATFSVA
jgi:hypothetical protein